MLIIKQYGQMKWRMIRVMCEWEYQYCTYKGLEFIIHHEGDELLFDVDCKGEFFLLDLGEHFEVVE